MLKVRDELLDGIDHPGLSEVVIGKDGFQFVEEGVHFGHFMASSLLHYSKGLEAVHIHLLTGDIELLIGLFASGIGLEINHGVGGVVVTHGIGILLGFRVGAALLLVEALGLHEVVADAAEGEHLVFAKLREENFSRSAEDACKHTDLAGFFGAHEVALHIARGGQGLLLLKPMQPAIGQGAVAEGHIGKAGGGDFEVFVIGHYQVFHDSLAGAHDVHRVGGLVGGDAEEVLGRIDR